MKHQLELWLFKGHCCLIKDMSRLGGMQLGKSKNKKCFCWKVIFILNKSLIFTLSYVTIARVCKFFCHMKN